MKSKSEAERDLLVASRNASAYFERFDKSLLQHAAAHYNIDWLLSDNENLCPIDLPGGLIKDFKPPSEAGKYTFLVPKPEPLQSNQRKPKPLALQELHQVIRELVEGIYIFNQLPSISLEPNHDCSTSCSIPSAYNDTLIGRTLLSLDYFIKSLLHGTIVSKADKLGKLAESWKRFPPAQSRKEFITHGMTTIQDDEELYDAYDDMKVPFIRYPPKCVSEDLASHQLTHRFTTGEEYEKNQAYLSRNLFLNHLHQVSIGMMFHQENIFQKDGIFLLHPSSEVVTAVLATSNETTDPSLDVRLQKYLQEQREFISRNLRKKRDIAHCLDLLSFTSFMIYFLVTLKKNRKIVELNSLLPSRPKDAMRTLRELPPIYPTSSSHWSPYLYEDNFTNMQGGISFLKTPLSSEVLVISDDDMAAMQQMTGGGNKSQTFPSLSSSSTSHQASLTDLCPSCEVGGKAYYIIQFSVETFYSKTPKLPRWAHAMMSELKTQCTRLPVLNDGRIQDLLKKSLGLRKAAAMKTVNVSLQASIENGILPAVSALLKRCTQTRLGKVDENGMTLLHYAAANARPEVISALVIAGCNVNQPVDPPDQPKSPTRVQAIHLAAKSGNFDAFCCLERYGADTCAVDNKGWAPVHYAAYYNSQSILRHLVTNYLSYLEVVCNTKLRETPILLASKNGCFDSFKCLVKLGADLSVSTSTGCNIVHLAALNHHTNILKYLIEINDERIDVWKVLSEMLKSEEAYAMAAARSLDFLTQWGLGGNSHLLEHNAIHSLVQLLKQDESMQLLALQVLANLSNVEEIKAALTSDEAIQHLVRLLTSLNDRIQACSILVLSDLALLPDAQAAIASAGAIPHLTKLLKSEIDDVQLFSCACVGILAFDNPKNQNMLADANAIPILVSLLRAPLSCIQSCAASALQTVMERNRNNQLTALAEHVTSPLIILLRSKESPLHKNAARAIEALAEKCEESQHELLSDTVCINLLKRMLKMRDQTVKVAGGSALWAIAGKLISNKRLIATHMGLELLVDLLTVHNPKLDYVCSEALCSLATELGDNQSRIVQVGGVKPLVEVLTLPISQKVCLSVINSLAALCMKPALVPNTNIQRAIAFCRGIVVLSSIVSGIENTEVVRVKAACLLAKLLLNNPENDAILSKHTDFSFLTIFQFFASLDPKVRLLAGYCLSVMAFNNPNKLKKMRSYGTLNISNFIPFLENSDDYYRVQAAFQVVVLAQLFTGIRDVDAVVKGIRLLVHLLSSEVERTKVLSAGFIASLARTGRGIPGAIVMAGVLDPLMANLGSGNSPVIESTSVALGYLSFNPVASRLMIGMFRDHPELFYVFKDYLPLIVYSQKFISDWEYIKIPGLPSLR